jgi:hypothetical protein
MTSLLPALVMLIKGIIIKEGCGGRGDVDALLRLSYLICYAELLRNPSFNFGFNLPHTASFLSKHKLTCAA